jgi:hypothetical protein
MSPKKPTTNSGQALLSPISGDVLTGLPPGLELLVSERPLIVGEDVGVYDDLLGTVLGSVKPADAIETMLVKDIVDLLWEVRRLRRWKAQVLANARREALADVLYHKIRPLDETGTIEDWDDARTGAGQ